MKLIALAVATVVLAGCGDGGRSDTRQIAKLTGPGSLNRTGPRWNVYGTDLGSSFEHRGRLYFVFGDTFGPPGRPPEFGSDWRSNVLAWSDDADPRDGIRFGGMIADRPQHAAEILPSKHGAGGEQTVIPTNGVSLGRRMVLHYMSVHHFGEPGHWTLNYSGLAYSDDDGVTWTKSATARWKGDSGFGQVAFVPVGAYVYLFGIPGGRFGSARLARVERGRLLRLDRYAYWTGRRWGRDEAQAAAVVPAPVGELSVQWSSYYRRWLMMYLNDQRDVVVLRTAACLTGPWSDEHVVVTAAQVPQLYAPYLPPRWNDRRDIYFTLSRFNLYDVFWWHTSLERVPGRNGAARCVSP